MTATLVQPATTICHVHKFDQFPVWTVPKLESAHASDSNDEDFVKVDVEGQLAMIVHDKYSDFVTATALAGGREFVIDWSESCAAKKDLVRLASKQVACDCGIS